MPMRLQAPIRLSIALLAGILAGPVAADETVLVPLIYFDPVPGTNGAQWKTDFTMENYGDEPWASQYFAAGCMIDGAVVPAHTTLKNPFCISTGEAAFVDVKDGQLIRFQLRVRDMTASADNLGTEIPVVRESRAFRGSSALLDVPSSADYRRTIRVYSISKSDRFRFTLRIRPLQATEVVFELSRELSVPHPAFPSEARLSDNFDLPDLSAFGALKIELVPDSNEVPYWWFLSLANNATNELTVVSPQ